MKPSLQGSFVLNPTTPHELISLSQSLKPTHSSGPDDIDPCVASSVVDLFSTPLALIINSSFTTGIVSSAIKQASVTNSKPLELKLKDLTILRNFVSTLMI